MKRSLLKLLLPPILSCTLIIGLWAIRGHTRFDETQFNIAQVRQHLEVLSGPDLKGRGLAEPGQVKTETYLESYFTANQLPYKVVPNQILVPSWQKNTQIWIEDTPQHIFEDFEPTADYYGTSIDFNGEILYTGRDLTQVPPSLMKDRIVCYYANRLTEEHIELARSAGAKGLLYHITYGGFDGGQSRTKQNHKILDMSHKKGTDLFMAEISGDMLRLLRDKAAARPIPEYTRLNTNDALGYSEEKLVGFVSNVKVQASLDYTIAHTKNYVVTIPGKSHQHATNLITHYDGLGQGVEPQTYYPSAVEGGISTSVLLEMARVAKLQTYEPIQDINFVFLSGLNVNNSSAVKTAEYLKPLASYQANWMIESIGYNQSPGYLIYWSAYKDLDRMLMSQIFSNYFRFKCEPFLNGEGTFTKFDRYDAFNSADSATLTFTDFLGKDAYGLLGSPADNIDIYNEQTVADFATLLLGHFDRQLYAEKDFYFIKNNHLLLMFALLMMVHLIVLPEKWASLGTAPAVLVKLSEQIPYKLLRKGILGILPFVLSIFVVNLILSVPSDVNLVNIGSTFITNFSLYDTFRYSYMGFIAFLSALSNPDPVLYKEISLYLSRSLILIGWGLGLAIGLGLLKGLLDAYWHKGSTEISTLTSIVLYSIPDVLIAFVSLVAVVYLSKIEWVNAWIDPTTMRLYVMPILSLTIVPIIYIARLVFVALEEEKKKEYVKFLQYKGLSKKQIYFRHFSKVGLIKILDAAKAIIMLIFSNLIVVEYLFNYPGIMYNLLGSDGDSIKVIILSLSIGLSFTSIYLLSVLVLNLIHPGRRMR